ncbi:unnamed protein product, partial [Pylaiella littoralis]
MPLHANVLTTDGGNYFDGDWPQHESPLVHAPQQQSSDGISYGDGTPDGGWSGGCAGVTNMHPSVEGTDQQSFVGVDQSGDGESWNVTALQQQQQQIEDELQHDAVVMEANSTGGTSDGDGVVRS